MSLDIPGSGSADDLNECCILKRGSAFCMNVIIICVPIKHIEAETVWPQKSRHFKWIFLNEFRLKCHCGLFKWVQLIIFQHSLQLCLNGCDGVSNHHHHDCLFNRLFRRRSKKTSTLCVTGLCARNSPVTREFPVQMASNAEKFSIRWRLRGFRWWLGAADQATNHYVNQLWLV